MNLKLILNLLLIVCGLPVIAQEKHVPVTEDVSRGSIFNPGVSYEKSIAKNQTVYGNAFMNSALILEGLNKKR